MQNSDRSTRRYFILHSMLTERYLHVSMYVCMGGVGEWEGEWCGRSRRQCPRGSKIKKYNFSTFCLHQILNYWAEKWKFTKSNFFQCRISVRSGLFEYSPRGYKPYLRHRVYVCMYVRAWFQLSVGFSPTQTYEQYNTHEMHLVWHKE